MAISFNRAKLKEGIFVSLDKAEEHLINMELLTHSAKNFNDVAVLYEFCIEEFG